MNVIKYTIIGYVALILYMLIITNFVNFMLPTYTFDSSSNPPAGLYVIFYYFIFAPLWEELAFRYAPINLAKDIKSRFLPIIIISSVLFGMIHNLSPNAILLQGGIGMILSFCYIKSKSYISNVIIHSLYNISIYYFF